MVVLGGGRPRGGTNASHQGLKQSGEEGAASGVLTGARRVEDIRVRCEISGGLGVLIPGGDLGSGDLLERFFIHVFSVCAQIK
jgi:hypothetical protein